MKPKAPKTRKAPKTSKAKSTKPKKNKIFHTKPKKISWADVDVTTLTKEEIKKGLYSMRRSVSRALRSTDASVFHGISTPAMQKLTQSGFFAGILEKHPASEFIALQSFMQDPTHTKKGADEWFNGISSAMGKTFRTFGDLSEEEQEDRLSMYWRAFNRMKDAFPWISAEPHRATDIINATKEELIENRLDLDLEGMTTYMMDYMKDEIKSLPSSVSSSWTFSTPGTYEPETIPVVETTYTITRQDMRRKEYRDVHHNYDKKS